MRVLLLASFLLAGDFGYQQVTWSPPQTIFGEPRSPSTAALDNWATTSRLGYTAWSLGDAKIDAATGPDVVYGAPDAGSVVAERSE
jgi:hypothetical protein